MTSGINTLNNEHTLNVSTLLVPPPGAGFLTTIAMMHNAGRTILLIEQNV